MTASTTSGGARGALGPERVLGSAPGGVDDDSGFGEYAGHAPYVREGFNRRIRRGPLGRAVSRLLGEREPSVLSVNIPYRLLDDADPLYYLMPLDEVSCNRFGLQGSFPRRVLLDQKPEAARRAAEEIGSSLANGVETRVLNNLFDHLIAEGRGVPSAQNGKVGDFPLAGLYEGMGCKRQWQEGHLLHEWIMTTEAWLRCNRRFERMMQIRSKQEGSINEPRITLNKEPVRTGWLNYETAALFGCFGEGITLEVSGLKIFDAEDKDQNGEPLASLRVKGRWAVGDVNLFVCWLFS